jgi:hypothetical protein
MIRKWCNRCNKYHYAKPVDPQKIIEQHAMDLAKHIDRMVIEELKNEQDRIQP